MRTPPDDPYLSDDDRENAQDWEATPVNELMALEAQAARLRESEQTPTNIRRTRDDDPEDPGPASNHPRVSSRVVYV